MLRTATPHFSKTASAADSVTVWLEMGVGDHPGGPRPPTRRLPRLIRKCSAVSRGWMVTPATPRAAGWEQSSRIAREVRSRRQESSPSAALGSSVWAAGCLGLGSPSLL